MPSRKELRADLTALTSEAFASHIPLHKTSYGLPESIQIKLQALISCYGLTNVDALLTKVNSAETNISAVQLRTWMRSVYMSTEHHNRHTYNLVCYINTCIGERTTLGRNQTLGVLLEATKEYCSV